MSNKIKWGVIGSGGIARRRTIPEGIIPAKNAELIAVYDINHSVNVEVAETYSAKAVGSIDELVALDIDAVYIASPVNCHLDHVIQASKAKKHIFCEKPLGLNVEEAEKIVSICREEGVSLGAGFMMRFMSQHREALSLIKKGKLGKPVFCRAQLSCWYPPLNGAWRQDPLLGGGGSLVDMGSHCIDLLEMFFGNVKSVFCKISNTVHPYHTEDSSVVTLVFDNGAMGLVDNYFCIPDNSSKNILELYGSEGSIIASGTIGQGSSGTMTAYLEGTDGLYDATQNRKNGDGINLDPVAVNTYCAEIEEFSQAIIEKRKPINDGETALRNQKIIAACYESAKTGESVNVKYN